MFISAVLGGAKMKDATAQKNTARHIQVKLETNACVVLTGLTDGLQHPQTGRRGRRLVPAGERHQTAVQRVQ